MRILIFLLCLLSSFTGFSQSAITVTHAYGKVLYTAPGQSAEQEIRPGASLSANGKIRCANPESSVRLLCNGKTYNFQSVNSRKLDELVDLSYNPSSIGFTNRFWTFISGCLDSTEDEKKLEENHKQFMEANVAGVKGFGKKEFSIRPDLRCSGSFSPQTLRFNWISPNQIFIFEISDNAGRTPVVRLMVKGNSLTLNLAELDLIEGVDYNWEVQAFTDAELVPSSPAVPFKLDSSVEKNIRAKVQSEKAYADVSPVEQQLMLAYSLEEAGCRNAAEHTYAELYASNPDDLLVQKTYAAFLMRMDQIEEARKVRFDKI